VVNTKEGILMFAGHTLAKTWVDETILNPRQAFLEGLTTGLKSPTGKGKRLIISHIGSEEGFVQDGLLIFEAKKGTEDYHQEMNAACFEEWFTNILTKVKQNSVIVIDNAPYHSRKANKVPNTKTKKADIQEWLRSKNINYGSHMVIATLLKLVASVKDIYETRVIDDMAAAKGITILRLPPYHCELNPIELIWAQVKGYVARNNKNFKISDVKQLFIQGVDNVSPQNWLDVINHVKKEEEKMLGLDHLIDEVTQRFIINVSGDETDSGTDVTDDE
jgi:transposase